MKKRWRIDIGSAHQLIFYFNTSTPVHLSNDVISHTSSTFLHPLTFCEKWQESTSSNFLFCFLNFDLVSNFKNICSFLILPYFQVYFKNNSEEAFPYWFLWKKTNFQMIMFFSFSSYFSYLFTFLKKLSVINFYGMKTSIKVWMKGIAYSSIILTHR